MQIKLVDVSKITPYYNNPRDNYNAVAPVVESIKRFGFVKPLVCDKKGVIIVGHTRYLAAVRLGLDKVPVVYSDMAEELAKQYRIADNKLAEKSIYDEDALIEELKSLEVPADMQAFFFEDINDMLNFNFDQFAAPTPTSAAFNPDEENEEGENGEDGETASEDGIQDPDDENGDDYGQVDTSELYRIKVVDGRRTMKVYCPYCGNIETISLD